MSSKPYNKICEFEVLSLNIIYLRSLLNFFHWFGFSSFVDFWIFDVGFYSKLRVFWSILMGKQCWLLFNGLWWFDSAINRKWKKLKLRRKKKKWKLEDFTELRRKSVLNLKFSPLTFNRKHFPNVTVWINPNEQFSWILRTRTR